MTQYEFTHEGHECLMTYDGGLPSFRVDGAPVPSGVVREDDIHHIDESPDWWKAQLKDWVEDL